MQVRVGYSVIEHLFLDVSVAVHQADFWKGLLQVDIEILSVGRSSGSEEEVRGVVTEQPELTCSCDRKVSSLFAETLEV